MNRQQRRAAEKRRKKGDPNQIMSDQVALFGKLPEACDACRKEFDKKDRDMARRGQNNVAQGKARRALRVLPPPWVLCKPNESDC